MSIHVGDPSLGNCDLFTAPADVHAAHADPFTPGGGTHGHLWRVSLGVRQDMNARRDVRDLLTALKAFAATLDHTDIGRVSTEDIAVAALRACPMADAARVEEVGVCEVVLWR